MALSTPRKPSPPQLSVTQLNRQARDLLEQGFGLIEVEGEISNFVRPSSGHWYFSLKDDQAQVRCALFRNRNQFLKYKPKNGDQVQLRAKVSLYEGRGEFQLIGDYLEAAGSGALRARFDALKEKLAAEGLFANAHKRPLPLIPRALGIITSPSGAAVQDILQVLQRRFPALPVYIYPAQVQGAEAPAQLIRALETANRDDRCDLLIIGRGGGSAEDLDAFNNESLARAIHASRLPIISAVGHESDIAISDLVADLRAPTPSAAAELASPEAETLQQRLLQLERRLLRGHRQHRLRLHARLEQIQRRLRHPGERLQQQNQRLDRLEIALQRRMAASLHQRQQSLASLQTRLIRQRPSRQISQLSERLAQLHQQLHHATQQQIHRQQQRIQSAARTLSALSPLATLGRGFAIVRNEQGEILRRSQDTPVGSHVEVKLAEGRLRCRVETNSTALDAP